MKTHSIIRTLAALAACTALLPVAEAQEGGGPRKPVRLVVPTSAGGISDAVARVYGEQMSKFLRQPVLVENMPGAGTLLAVRHVVKSPPDGHTLIVSANTIVTMPYVNRKAGYSPTDLTAVGDLGRSPMVLVVSGSAPYRTLAQLVDSAKRSPGTLTFASVGTGTTSHLPVEMFARTAEIKLLLVPYKGISLAVPDVVAERVTLMMGTAPSVGELSKSGKLRALAVTSESRSRDLPAVPTFRELGYADATYELFLVMLAPSGTPVASVRSLADAVAAAKKDPELLKRLEAQGQELSKYETPEQLNRFLRGEEERMKKLIREANIVVEQ